jgi:hypothetical protein
MEGKLKQIKTMLAAAEKEYDELSIYDNGLATPEKVYRNIRLHSRVQTLKDVMNVLEGQG